ncbi:MAG: DUF4937 domain-containing protein [Pseudonocardiaceae bacterium]
MKWIRCEVIDRSGFDRGQRAWTSLCGLPGFLGQRGGWQQHSAGIAHIVAFWADHSSYDRRVMWHGSDRAVGKTTAASQAWPEHIGNHSRASSVLY